MHARSRLFPIIRRNAVRGRLVHLVYRLAYNDARALKNSQLTCGEAQGILGGRCTSTQPARAYRFSPIPGRRARQQATGFRLRRLQKAGRGRQPQSPSQQQSLLKLRDQIQCLLAAEGFVDEPLGGCPVGESIDNEQVARIVEGVVGELKRRGMA